jgi:hypothetical protein
MDEQGSDSRRRLVAELNEVASRRIAELEANLDRLRNSTEVDFALLIRECEEVIATIQHQIRGLDATET